MQALQHDSTVVVTLPFRASSVRSARARITGDLKRARLSRDVIEDVQVVVSELVGNAVRHAAPLSAGRLIVSWRVDPDAVVVSVTDGGSSATPRVTHPTEDSLGGRGMAIIETLARRWWLDRSAGASTVTAEIPLR